MASQSNGSRRDPECERQWRERVAAWEASGLTARAFCQERGLVMHTLYAWRRELRKRDAEKAGGQSSSRTTRPPEFIAVNVTSAAAGGIGMPVEIVLPDATRVRVHGEAEVSTIANALRALRETASC